MHVFLQPIFLVSLSAMLCGEGGSSSIAESQCHNADRTQEEHHGPLRGEREAERERASFRSGSTCVKADAFPLTSTDSTCGVTLVRLQLSAQLQRSHRESCS